MTARAFTVLRPGLLTTVQDLGRWGHQAVGVPVAGAMDTYSLRLANGLVGNPETAAALEVTLLGPTLRAEAPLVIAVAGAIFDLQVDGQPVAHGAPIALAAGSVLRFQERRAGARAYLAVAGGIDTPRVLGSRATHLVSRMGGLDGRALVAGDVVPVASTSSRPARRATRAPLPLASAPGARRLRVLLGPQDEWFTLSSVDALLGGTFSVSPQSDRMGFRLDGPALTTKRPGELVSEPVVFGSIQVPSGGAPILLMADRQTAGGYPKIATVITADLPLAGQLAPGESVRFAACTRAEARSALVARERDLLRALPEGGDA
ncbi:MAG: biotin-dependent carboxyltransferase family protein [Acidobacteria bacterium]|nr:biotin-dependent carboxyltransferase family protein [Acidobacteriota bacterium]